MSIESESEKLLKAEVVKTDQECNRYNWISVPLPWFWLFTFWRKKMEELWTV